MREKTYCLFGSCRKFDPQKPELCNHHNYICTGKPDCFLSLEEAKKQYPDTKFCEAWEVEAETCADDKESLKLLS